MRTGRLLLIRIAVIAALAAAVVALMIAAPVAEGAVALASWVRGAGIYGVAAFAGLYIVATVLLVPGSLLTASAGFAYGPVYGTLLVSPVSVLAALVSFALARTVLRDRLEQRLRSRARLAAVNEAVGRRGFVITALLRLSPILPFNLLNYLLGLSRVRVRDYALASWVGMLPATVLYVYAGSLVTRASQLSAGGARPAQTWRLALYAAGLVATAAAVAVTARLARRTLRREGALSTSEEVA